MILNLITLDTVKTQLSIATGDYDAALTAMIPIVSSDVRRILNTNYDLYVPATITSGSPVITIGSSTFTLDYPIPFFDMGQVTYNANIPLDTYITSFDPETSEYTLSANATGSGDYFYPTLVIAQWPTVSKMVWYRTTQNNITTVDTEKLKSDRIGPLSKTYADSEINKQWNYPQTLIDDLGIPYAEVG